MKTYVRELAARLPAVATDLRFTVVTNVDLVSSGARVVRMSDNAAANVSIGEYVALPRLLERDADLAHLMSMYGPLRLRVPYVQTIHDLIHLRFPAYFSWRIPLYYRLLAGPSARRARAVITDAHATVSDLRNYLAVRPGDVRVIPLGVSDSFRLDPAQRAEAGVIARDRYGLSRPYILYAGNARRHKNLETLFRAWSSLDRECDLCITSTEALSFDADRYVSQGGRIVRLGHVEEVDLISLYAGAGAVVQPSLYEGFGLSVLEALAAGAPVIVAQTPALLEVAGDAALTFAPTDAAALADGLRRVLAGGAEIEELVTRGRRRVENFTWQRVARMTADVYRESLAR